MRRFVIVFSIMLLMLTFSAPAFAQTTTVHIVAPGETLFRIATRYGTSVQAIAAANNIFNPNYVFAGQRLIIPFGTGGPPPIPQQPTGTVYFVRPGDTLASIAFRFGTTVQAIVSANGIINPNIVYVGQRLVIPSVGTGGPLQGRTVYIVGRGDDLARIARRFGTTVQAIASANGIFNVNLIYPGQQLTIPIG